MIEERLDRFDVACKPREEHPTPLSPSGPYYDFHEAVTRAKGEFLGLAEEIHHRLAVAGNISRRPLTRKVIDDKGREMDTGEIIRRCATCQSDEPNALGCANHKPEIVFIEVWEQVSPEAKMRGIEWELRFHDREGYSDRADDKSAGNQVDQIPIAVVQELLRRRGLMDGSAQPKPIETTATPVEEEEPKALPAPTPDEDPIRARVRRLLEGTDSSAT